jgi:RNA 2',3'-cyclic 3'-phosphodiesterase
VTRLFVAVWPADHVIEHVRAIRRHGWEDVRWTPEVNWHVTLQFLGDADPDLVIDAVSAADLPPAIASVGSRPEIMARTSLVLPVTGVDGLAGAVRRATGAIGVGDGDQRFRGHLTIGRSRGRRAISPDRTAPGSDRAVEFTVDEVALVASQLSSEGATYTTLATFTTSGGGAR